MVYSVTLDLTTKSEREAELQVDGSRAIVAIESTKVLVSDVGATTPHEAQAKARAVAPKLLDILCSLYDHCLRLGVGDPATDRIDSVQSAHIEADDGTIALGLEDGVRFSFKHRVQSHDAAGNVIADSWKPGLIPFEHLPAMAYFRSAMLTQNVFHKFQDFYLAIENAAASLHRELRYDRLLEAALVEVYQLKMGELVAVAVRANLTCTQADVISKVKKCLWKHRLNMFHAGQKPVTTVSDPKHEARVAQVIPLAQEVARGTIRFAAQQKLARAASVGEMSDSHPI